MHRIDTPGNDSGQFVSGNPFAATGPIEGTVVGPDWLGALQEELLAVIEGRGISPDKGDNTQLQQALEKLLDDFIGRLFTYTAPADVTAGDPRQHRDVFGIVLASVTSGNTATLQVRGRFLGVDKASADNITKGDLLRFDSGTEELTTQTGGGANVVVGYADSDAAPATTAVDVVLLGPPNE